MSTKITDITARDIRFPTSQSLAGSDAMNPAPDYSAAYVVLKTDHPRGLEGHGLHSPSVGSSLEAIQCKSGDRSTFLTRELAGLEWLFWDRGVSEHSSPPLVAR